MATENYNSSELIRGDEFFLYVKTSGDTYQPVAYATSASISLSQESLDCSNKMSGVWSNALAGKLSWTVSTSALMSYKSTGYSYFYDKMIQRTPFLIKFGQVTDLTTGDFTSDDTKAYYTGNAYLTSLNLTSDNGSVASFDVEFQGDGALTKTETKA